MKAPPDKGKPRHVGTTARLENGSFGRRADRKSTSPKASAIVEALLPSLQLGDGGGS